MHALKSVFIIILITKVDENHESLHSLSDMICFSQALCHSRVRISIAAFAMAFGSLAVSAASKKNKKPKRGKTFQDTIIENLDCRSCQHWCKAKRCSSLATGLSTTNWRNNYWFSTHATSAKTYMLSWISEMACESSSPSHCDASLLLPFPPFILKMEGPDCRSCQHGCKAKRCSSLATGFPPAIKNESLVSTAVDPDQRFRRWWHLGFGLQFLGTKYLKQQWLHGLQHLATQCLRIVVSRGPEGHRTSW